MDMVTVTAGTGTETATAVTGIVTAMATETVTAVTANETGTGIATEIVMGEERNILANDTMRTMVTKTLGLKGGIKTPICHYSIPGAFGGYP
jgi:hypothetical protein